MELTPADLKYFVRYMLLDEASREPAKRQTHDLEGVFTTWWSVTKARNTPARQRRQSDLRERRFVCIHALKRIGEMSVSKAAVHVATVLGGRNPNAKDVDTIREDYYEFRRGPPGLGFTLWCDCFFSWREWAFSLEVFHLAPIMEWLAEKYGKRRADQIAELIEEMRRDSEQKARNAVWQRENQALLTRQRAQ